MVLEFGSGGGFSIDDACRVPSSGGECPGVYLPTLCVTDGSKNPAMIFLPAMKNLWAAAGAFKRSFTVIVYEKLPGTVDGNSRHWADYDKKRHRVLYAGNGALYQMRVDKNLSAPELLHDFNDMKFQALKAPC